MPHLPQYLEISPVAAMEAAILRLAIVAPTLVLYTDRDAGPWSIGATLPWSPGGLGLPATIGAMLRVMYEATAN